MIEDNKQNKTVDLSNTLKDSNNDIGIQNEQQSNQVFFPGTPKIIQWVIKYSGGLIKDEKQAQYVILGFVVLVIIISLFLIFGGGGKQEIFTPEAEAPAEEVMPPAEF